MSLNVSSSWISSLKMKNQLKTRQLTCLVCLKINKKQAVNASSITYSRIAVCKFHKFRNYELKVVRTVRCTVAHSGALHVPRDNFKWMLQIVCTTNVQLFKWVGIEELGVAVVPVACLPPNCAQWKQLKVVLTDCLVVWLSGDSVRIRVKLQLEQVRAIYLANADGV